MDYIDEITNETVHRLRITTAYHVCNLCYLKASALLQQDMHANTLRQKEEFYLGVEGIAFLLGPF